MNQAEVEAFVEKLPNVQREENYGYIFYFVGDEHLLSFVTIAQSDNDYDKVSNLDREGVFRVNIGVSKETFAALFGDSLPETIDYSALDVFMPHPDYAQQHFICILSPSPENDERLKQYITEAHAVATARQIRRQKL
jgi:hypothetical protein